jgi:predicted Zn-dependent peptidase
LIHDLLSDRVLHSCFSEEVIEREKGVIIEEIRTGRDDISTNLTKLWLKLLYGNQAIGRDPTGTIKNIRAIRREQLLDYMKKLYVASNSAVCLAGHIPNPAGALEDIEQFFGSMSRSAPALQMAPVVEKQKTPAILLQFNSLEQANVFLGVRTCGLLHPDHAVLDVIAALLGGYASSRIFLELRGRGFVYDVGVTSGCYSDAGYLVAYASLDNKNLIEGMRIIMNHYRSIAAGEFSEEEVERAKSYLIGAQKMDLENSCDMAMDLATQFALCGKVMTSEEEDGQIQMVTPADVSRVAQDIFVNAKLNLAIICPPKKGLEDKIAKILSF